jgi:hypothetical protein
MPAIRAARAAESGSPETSNPFPDLSVSPG